MDRTRASELLMRILAVVLAVALVVGIMSFGVVLGHAARLATRNAQEYHGVE